MAAADLEAGVMAYLATGADVVALAGTRFFGGELPDDETDFMPRKAVLVQSSGGISLASGSTVETDTRRVDITTYGETPREAGQLMSEVALHLKRLRRSIHGGVLLHWANSAGGSATGREPQTEWPRAIQSFQILHALEAVT